MVLNEPAVTDTMAEAPPLYAAAGRRGLAIPLAPFRARAGGEAQLRRVLAALTVTERVHAGRPRGMARATRQAYLLSRDTLIVPRVKGAALGRGARPLLDGARPGAGADAPLPAPRRLAPARLAADEPLYEYQEAAVRYLCGPAGPLGDARVAAGGGVAYLQMDTGLGKSRVGCAVIAARAEPALIVAPTDAIAVQWLDELSILYPDLVAALYRNPPKGSRRVPPGPATHDVVVIIVNTFREKEPDFLEGYGTVVLDEAHEYHSPRNCRALWLAQTRAVLGLSATPLERPDGFDRYVTLHLGPVVYPRDIPGFDVSAAAFAGEVRQVEYAGHPDCCETAVTPAGTMSAILTIGNLCRDAARLRLVAAEVRRLCDLHRAGDAAEVARLGLGPRPAAAATPRHPAGGLRRHGVFVFAEHRAYLPALRGALLEQFAPAEVAVPELGAEPPQGAPPLPISILRGGVQAGAVGEARDAGAHVVLTTYGFSRRGISLPDMTAIVLATPRRNGARQILGRILRRGSDQSIRRQVVDIVDVRTGLRGQAADRRKVYKEKGYPITKVAASWEEYAAEGAGGAAPPAAALVDEVDLTELTTEELLAAALGEEAPAADDPPGGAETKTAPLAEENFDSLIDDLLSVDGPVAEVDVDAGVDAGEDAGEDADEEPCGVALPAAVGSAASYLAALGIADDPFKEG